MCVVWSFEIFRRSKYCRESQVASLDGEATLHYLCFVVGSCKQQIVLYVMVAMMTAIPVFIVSMATAISAMSIYNGH